MKSCKKYFYKNKMLLFSLTVLMTLLLIAAFAPFISPYHHLLIDLEHIKEPPNINHWFGTDTLGRDVLSRVIYGSRVSLVIGCSATILSLCLGLLVGLIAGYFGGKIDTLLTVIIDLFLAFPSLLLAIGISVLMPPGLVSTIIALCVVGWASFARLFRSMVLSLKESIFVDAARSIGCSRERIIFFHILPHCIPIAVVAASLKVGSFILSESALSFLGLGIQPPLPTWGSMVSLNRAYLPSAPWVVLFPGGAIALTVLIFNLFGDAFRDKLDPNLKI
jgi:ABC-type dipeptide/oligopeptide/nickel transport system permease subunit